MRGKIMLSNEATQVGQYGFHCFFPWGCKPTPLAVVWGHGSSFSIHKYVLDQARQLQEFQTPVYSINPCSFTSLQSLQDEFLHRFWPTHKTMHWMAGKQDKGLQGFICEELGLMVSPFCYGGLMVSYELAWWPDYTNAELQTYSRWL